MSRANRALRSIALSERRSPRAWPCIAAALGMALLLAGCSLPFPVSLARARARERRPIPNGPNARTERDVRRASAAFHRRTLAEAYEKISPHDPRWDKAALAFLETFAKQAVAKTEMKPSQLAAQAKAVIDLGCNDPLVLYCYGVALQEMTRPHDAEPVLKRALAGLEKRKYPRVRLWSAATRLAQISRKLGGKNDPDATRYLGLSLKYLPDSLSDGSYQPGEQGIFLDLLDSWLGDPYQGIEVQVYEAIESNPKADPYVVKVIGGRAHIAAAWQARGENWGSEVTKEGWKGFEEHLDPARELLVAAWKLDPDLPQAPGDMITVAMAGAQAEGGNERLWFDRSVAAQMDYDIAYGSYLWALRPRWGGSHEEMYQFGLECLETGRFDTDVPMVFAHSVREITDDLDGKPTYWEKPETYRHLQVMFDGYAKAQPSESKWFDSVRAAAEYRCGHPDKARELLDRLGGDLDEAAFQQYAGVDVAVVRKETKARPAPPASDASELPRRVLSGFDVFTSDEAKFIYANEGTWKQAWPSETARIADADQRITYQFTIPPGVSEAALTIRVLNNFAIAAARDDNGNPGEFHEELNSVKCLGRRCFNAENDHEQVVNLTPYLADNPSRKVYVAVYSSYPQGGWGAAFTRLEVVALDAAEKRRIKRLTAGLADLVKRNKEHYLLNFPTDGGAQESRYIYQQAGSPLEPGLRKVGGDGYIIYYFPLSAKYVDCDVLVWVQGDHVVSMAPATKGKPGRFRVEARARDKYSQSALEQFANMDDIAIGIPKATIATGGCYVKIADAEPKKPPDVIIRDISLHRP